ncbi:hypothetical protein [Spongorhabdus nitratireducens]
MCTAGTTLSSPVAAADLIPGDILVYENIRATDIDGDVVHHQRVRKLSWLTFHGAAIRKGSVRSIHTAIVVEVTDTSMLVAHALNCGIALVRKNLSERYESGEKRHVFRCEGYQAYAVSAAHIARSWVQNHQGVVSKKSALVMREEQECDEHGFCYVEWQQQAYSGSMELYVPNTYGVPHYLHNSGYGSGARAFVTRLATFASDVPAELQYHPGTLAATGMACTTLVIAAWQAALGPDDASWLMALDARYTSPPALQGYLLDSHHWRYLGSYGISASAAIE